MTMATDAEREAMSQVITSINTLIAANDWEGLDAYLIGYNLNQASKYEMIALVRSSYPVRSKLKEWWNLVAQVSLRVDERSLSGII